MGQQQSEAKAVATYTPAQRALLDQLVAYLGPQIGQGAEVYPGQITPPASALQQQLFGLPQQYQGALGGLTGGQPAYQVDPAQRQQVYESQKAQAMADYSDFTRAASERYQSRGAGRSGGLLSAFGREAGRLSNQLNLTQSGLEYQDEQARRASLESAAGRQLPAMGFQAGLYGQAGGLQRAIAGQMSAEEFQRWQAAQPYANPALQYLPVAFGAQPYSTGVESDSRGLFGMLEQSAHPLFPLMTG